MKIFFIGSDRRNPQDVDNYKKIAQIIEKEGNTVDRSWINATTEDDAENFEVAHKRNIKSIKEADVIVAEITKLTTGTGFLLSTAISQKKPVITLFNEESDAIPSTTIKGSSNKKNMFYAEYNSKTVQPILEDFLSDVKNLLDTKFILIISPEIDRYLEWASENRRMHKAQIVRNAIEDIMEKDKEYQDYLNN